MFRQGGFDQPILAQTSRTQALPAFASAAAQRLWLGSTIGLALILVAVVINNKLQRRKLLKKLKFERYKTKHLRQKLELALTTLNKLETNPDLIHSREFNLDYLRMRMEETLFHHAVINQIKVRIRQIIGAALRPSTADNFVGITPASGRQVDEIFDVDYQIDERGKRQRRVLFRIHVQLKKLPTQVSSKTVSEVIDCVETFLSSQEDRKDWQPVIHKRIVYINWDQKAKPTPLLVLQQSNEGVNVSSPNSFIRQAQNISSIFKSRKKSASG